MGAAGSAATAPRRTPGRAGRNLPAAISVGVALVAIVLVPLYTLAAAFVGVVALAAVVGIWEMRSAVAAVGRRLPAVPVLLGAAAIPAAAFARGAEAMVLAFLLTIAAVFAWRATEPAAGYLRDAAAGAMAALYVPFLAGFAVLLLDGSHGPMRVSAFIAVVVCNDVGGYAAGVLFGTHPMAPTVSPKKSWEGFAGSMVTCAAAGAGFVVIGFGAAWWQGVCFGVALAICATVGDLGESMVKRDLGLKDMGTLLPGHGGLMDRLDSMLVAAPVAWLLLAHIAAT